MLRIAIVDDHQIVRAGFREMLADELDFEFAFEAATGEEALAGLRAHDTDVLLLDLSLPGQSGVDVLRAARQRHDRLRVLVLSGFPEERYALSMIRNGADGYLCKDCTREELVGAIRTVAQGRRYLSPRTAELLARELTGETSAAPHEKLSDRELQTLTMIASGKRLSDIAEELLLSPKTVSVYRARVLEKLKLANNAELTVYAIRNRLV